MKKFNFPNYFREQQTYIFAICLMLSGSIILVSGYPSFADMTAVQLHTIALWLGSAIFWAVVSVISYNRKCIDLLVNRVLDLEEVVEKELRGIE